MGYQNILLEKEDKIAVLTINRPKAMNALNNDTITEIIDAVTIVSADADVDVLIITGADKAFVAGADIAFMQNLTAMEARAFGALGQKAFRMVEAMEKPVIAAVKKAPDHTCRALLLPLPHIAIVVPSN